MKHSYSSISSYSVCGERYRLRYQEKWKDRFPRSSLLFGGAIDAALNDLAMNRDLSKATAIFDEKWAKQIYNGEEIDIKTDSRVIFAKADLQTDLISSSELNPSWASLLVKGHLMLEAYEKEVLPKISEVIAVQHESIMKNDAGEEVVQILDLVLKLHDGRIVLFDNKTSANMRYYPIGSAGKSPQLVSYFYENKEKFKLTHVGYIVMLKNILLNKTKICKKCGYNGTGASHKTCPDRTENGRCNGTWLENISPSCKIEIIVDEVTSGAEDEFIKTFDDAVEGITAGDFPKNLDVCDNIFGSPCCYKKICFGNDYSDVVKSVSSKDKK